MKIFVLMENTAFTPDYKSEHGLSLYIETKKHKLLFDMGQSDAYIENANKLGVNLSDVDIAFLSHGHYDHSGGLKSFLEINDYAFVYLSKLAFGQHFHKERYIGINQELKNSNRLIFVDDELKIDSELSLCSCNKLPRNYETDSAGLTEKIGNSFQPDMFLHEQYLTINDNNRKIVLSGCSHKGILNIMEWLKPNILIGGFHFKNIDIKDGNNTILDNTAKILNDYNTEYYTCHCTGALQYDYLKEIMGAKLHNLSAGEVVEL